MLDVTWESAMRCQRCGQEACQCPVPVYAKRRASDDLGAGGCLAIAGLAIVAFVVGNSLLTWAANNVTAFWLSALGVVIFVFGVRLFLSRR